MAIAMAAACAADSGDAAKTLEDGMAPLQGASGGSVMLGGDGSYGGQDSTTGNVDNGGGSTSSSGIGATSGSSGSSSSSSSSASGSNGGSSGGSDATASDGASTEAAPIVDGAACLIDTGTCAVCATQNSSDVPKCMQYLSCYETNGCNPHTACGSMDSVCGVNTIGGGNAPQTAAIATYDCACH